MRLVIADTGLVNYLILIGHIDLLPALFEKVILPAAVQANWLPAKLPLPYSDRPPIFLPVWRCARPR